MGINPQFAWVSFVGLVSFFLWRQQYLSLPELIVQLMVFCHGMVGADLDPNRYYLALS